jgi:CBS domain-containing protein
MLIKDVMTDRPMCCKPADKIDVVARLMMENDIGEIPVCDEGRIVGVITDRDITCRVVAVGRTPEAVRVSEVMTKNVVTINEDATLEEAFDLMKEKLVRRLPVVDKGKVIGIVSQADMVAKSPTFKVARAIKSVSKKTRREARAHV